MISIIDFETTGLTDDRTQDWMKQPGIVQIGVVNLNPLRGEIRRYNALVNPEISASNWSEKAIETHGIKPEMVADAPSFMGLFSEFSDLVRGSLYWAGYNTKFDRDVLWHQLMRYGLERNFPWPPQEIDVMKLATKHLNAAGRRGSKWFKLTDAYEQIVGGQFAGAHDALADVLATKEILMKIGTEYFE